MTLLSTIVLIIFAVCGIIIQKGKGVSTLKINRITEELLCDIYICFLVSVNLLFFGFRGYSAIFSAKASLFTAVSWIFIILTGSFSFVRLRQSGHANLKYIFSRLSPVHFATLSYAFFTLVSAIVSERFPKTIFGVSRFEGAFTIITYCIVFILVSLFGKAKMLHFYTLLVSSLCFFAVCILQFLSFNPFSLYPGNADFYDAGRLFPSRFLGTIGNANLVGGFMCILLPILIFALICGKRFTKLVSLPVLAMALVTVCKMETESVYVGLLAFAVFSIPVLLKLKKRGVAIYAAIILVLLSLFLVFVYCSDFEGGVMYELSEVLHGNFDEKFGSNRIRIWKNVLSVIDEAPVFGKGPDTMLLENFEPFTRYYPDKGRDVTTTIDVAHNEFLNVLYHQGIVGLASYLAIVISAFIKWLKSGKKRVSSALLCACVCYLAQSFFTFSMCLSAPYFWVCLALACGNNE